MPSTMKQKLILRQKTPQQVSQVANRNSKQKKSQKARRRSHIQDWNSIKCINHMPITHSHIRVLIEK